MEEREKFVTRRDATLVAIVSAMLGGVLSWILFTAPGRTWITEDKGSAADWLAAIFAAIAAFATLAIGRGANRYAHEAHRQRLREDRRDQAQAKKSRKLTFDGIILRLHRAKLLHRLYEEVPSGGTVQDLPFDQLERILLILRGALRSVRWPIEELRLLSGPSQVLIGQIENYVNALDSLIEIARDDEKAGRIDDCMKKHEAMRYLCLEISRVCDQTQPRLLVEREEP
ncbi:hypothetical protein [Stenotrophomonas maltophilia]|uniref:hypothetical protein n=1 Tax=Stenotrophomonas maltophilia TaxID=40324 RepID=UPI003453EAEC